MARTSYVQNMIVNSSIRYVRERSFFSRHFLFFLFGEIKMHKAVTLLQDGCKNPVLSFSKLETPLVLARLGAITGIIIMNLALARKNNQALGKLAIKFFL